MAGSAQLSAEDLEWFRRKRKLSAGVPELWEQDSFHREYGNQWVAIAGRHVECHDADADRFIAWLDEHDPRRERFTVRFVPPADAEYAFSIASNP